MVARFGASSIPVVGPSGRPTRCSSWRRIAADEEIRHEIFGVTRWRETRCSEDKVLKEDNYCTHRATQLLRFKFGVSPVILPESIHSVDISAEAKQGKQVSD